MQQPNNETIPFQKKVWITVGIVALAVIVLSILKVTVNVLLLVLAGALIALYFRGLAGLLHRVVKLPKKAALPVAIIGSLLLLVLFFWFAGSRIQTQAAQLTNTLPGTVENFKQKLSESPLGQQVLSQASGSGEKASAVIKSFFRSTFGVLGDVYVVLFLGLFFTASSKTYVSGFIKLIPPKSRPKAEDVVTKIGSTLTKWLKGKIFSMLVVAVLTAIGLWAIGMPMIFVLALIAGLLNFIPNFGPLLAMIPAVLVGLMQGTTTALLVAGLYIVVQMLESNVITPQIQKRLISIPPALIILGQLFMGVLTGGWGLVLATPIIAILMVVLQELYIKPKEAAQKA